MLRSSWAHCSDIVKRAEAQGFRNILCPSSYQVGQDTLSFVAGCAPITDEINLLAAIRCGEMQPIMLARTVATLDHMLQGRLTLNVISSDFPGEVADSAYRYKRSHEVVEILRQAWTRDHIDYDGEVYQIQQDDHRSRPPLSAERRAASVLRRLFPRRAGTLRRAVRRLPDVARTEGDAGQADAATSTRAPRRMAARWTTACAST